MVQDQQPIGHEKRRSSLTTEVEFEQATSPSDHQHQQNHRFQQQPQQQQQTSIPTPLENVRQISASTTNVHHLKTSKARQNSHRLKIGSYNNLFFSNGGGINNNTTSSSNHTNNSNNNNGASGAHGSSGYFASSPTTSFSYLNQHYNGGGASRRREVESRSSVSSAERDESDEPNGEIEQVTEPDVRTTPKQQQQQPSPLLFQQQSQQFPSHHPQKPPSIPSTPRNPSRNPSRSNSRISLVSHPSFQNLLATTSTTTTTTTFQNDQFTITATDSSATNENALSQHKVQIVDDQNEEINPEQQQETQQQPKHKTRGHSTIKQTGSSVNLTPKEIASALLRANLILEQQNKLSSSSSSNLLSPTSPISPRGSLRSEVRARMEKQQSVALLNAVVIAGKKSANGTPIDLQLDLSMIAPSIGSMAAAKATPRTHQTQSARVSTAPSKQQHHLHSDSHQIQAPNSARPPNKRNNSVPARISSSEPIEIEIEDHDDQQHQQQQKKNHKVEEEKEEGSNNNNNNEAGRSRRMSKSSTLTSLGRSRSTTASGATKNNDSASKKDDIPSPKTRAKTAGTTTRNKNSKSELLQKSKNRSLSRISEGEETVAATTEEDEDEESDEKKKLKPEEAAEKENEDEDLEAKEIVPSLAIPSSAIKRQSNDIVATYRNMASRQSEAHFVRLETPQIYGSAAQTSSLDFKFPKPSKNGAHSSATNLLNSNPLSCFTSNLNVLVKDWVETLDKPTKPPAPNSTSFKRSNSNSRNGTRNGAENSQSQQHQRVSSSSSDHFYHGNRQSSFLTLPISESPVLKSAAASTAPPEMETAEELERMFNEDVTEIADLVDGWVLEKERILGIKRKGSSREKKKKAAATAAASSAAAEENVPQNRLWNFITSKQSQGEDGFDPDYLEDDDEEDKMTSAEKLEEMLLMVREDPLKLAEMRAAVDRMKEREMKEKEHLTDFTLRNIEGLELHSPETRLKHKEMAAQVHNSRLERNHERKVGMMKAERERRMQIIIEKELRRIEFEKMRRDRPKELDPKEMSFFWATFSNLALFHIRLDRVMVDLIEKRREFEKRDEAARVIQLRFVPRYKLKKYGRLNKAKQILLRNWFLMVLATRISRKRRASKFVAKFLTDVSNSQKIVRAVKRYLSKIIMCQRYIKMRLQRRLASVELLKLQWDREEARIVVKLKRDSFIELKQMVLKKLEELHHSSKHSSKSQSQQPPPSSSDKQASRPDSRKEKFNPKKFPTPAQVAAFSMKGNEEVILQTLAMELNIKYSENINRTNVDIKTKLLTENLIQRKIAFRKIIAQYHVEVQAAITESEIKAKFGSYANLISKKGTASAGVRPGNLTKASLNNNGGSSRGETSSPTTDSNPSSPQLTATGFSRSRADSFRLAPPALAPHKKIVKPYLSILLDVKTLQQLILKGLAMTKELHLQEYAKGKREEKKEESEEPEEKNSSSSTPTPTTAVVE